MERNEPYFLPKRTHSYMRKKYIEYTSNITLCIRMESPVENCGSSEKELFLLVGVVEQEVRMV